MSVIFLVLLTFELLYFLFVTKDIFHPACIFLSIWLISCAISCVDNNNFMSPWSNKMYLVIFLSSFSFWLGSILLTPLRKTRRLAVKGNEFSPILVLSTRLLTVFCLCCFMLEWYKGGMYVFSISDVGQPDLKSEIDGDIPGIHYGTLFLPFIAVLTFFNIQNAHERSKFDRIAILLIIMISLFMKISRGDLIIYILSFMFIYSRYNKIKLQLILIAMAVLILMFGGVMMLRVNEDSIIMNTTSNPAFSIFYTYIATCFANLNDLINQNLDYNLAGNATFAPLWSLVGIKDNFPVTSIDQLEVFNARTYLYGFYHDFKIFGIIFFPFLLGMTLSYLYNLSLYKSYWILLLAVLQKAIFTPFFGNYFFGELVILFPYLLTSFLIVISYYPRTPGKFKTL